MSPRVLHVMESWKSYCSVTLSALLVECNRDDERDVHRGFT